MSEQNCRMYRNELLNLIKDCNNTITRSEETIERFKSSTDNVHFSLDFKKSQISKMKLKIEETNEKIVEYTNELKNLDEGNLNEKIDSKYKEQSNNVSLVKTKNKRIKDTQDLEDNVNKEVSEKYYNNIRISNNSDYQQKKEMRYYWKIYNKIVYSLPNYMRQNLKDMPNNKGYIWRGCWFMGDKKPESNTLIMFEKQKGGILIIHEIDDYNHKTFSKEGNGKRILLSNKKLRVIPKFKINKH